MKREATKKTKKADSMSSEEMRLLNKVLKADPDIILQEVQSWGYKMYPASVTTRTSKNLTARKFEVMCSGDSWVTIEPSRNSKAVVSKKYHLS